MASQVVGAHQFCLLISAVHILEIAVAHGCVGVLVSCRLNRKVVVERRPRGGRDGKRSACWGEVDEQSNCSGEIELGDRILRQYLNPDAISGSQVRKAVPDLYLRQIL